MSVYRKIQVILFAGVLGVLALFLAGGWYYSGEIEARALMIDHEPDPFDLRVASITGGRITLDTTPEAALNGRWSKPGLWGLVSDDTYNQVGEIVQVTDDSVVRELIPLGPLPQVGDPVRIDSFAYPEDPLTAHGIEFQEVGVPAALGTFPAWLTLGDSDTWVILTHGRTVGRQEALRILPTFVEAGYPTLTITYRNDRELPQDPDGYYRFGATEWEELESAATFALAAGAKDLVLVGYSMGGGISLNFLYNSSVAYRVKGVILDAPVLDFSAVVDYAGSLERMYGIPVPGVLTDLAKFLSALRFGFDFNATNYLKRADELAVPILLFHGDDDLRSPVWLSQRLYDARPDIVDYHVFPGAKHVNSWNAGRERYEEAVRDFMAGLED